MENRIKQVLLILFCGILSTGYMSAQAVENTYEGDIPRNPFKAPLYWSVYEYNYLREQAGTSDNYIPESVWLANINWVDENLKHLGYTMICIDGWGNVDYNVYGYRTKHSGHWQHDYAWWSAELQKRDMTLGIYDNPLWVNKAAANQKIKGTNIPISSIIDYEEESLFGFTWVQVDRPGAEEYVKGYVQHYADMGVKYLRVDFLSWYESGTDANLGVVGRTDRPYEHYVTALRWMREACDENDVFLSLVMPHLKNDAEVELKYGHMIRINEDTAEGGWWRFSENARGVQKDNWSQFRNPFDGFIYWSQFSGRHKMILDGDFIRLNTYANDEERKTVVSLNLMAGGPVTVSDQHNTIGSSLWIYQNEEMMELNHDGFVGQPLSFDPKETKSQVWKGQLSNGNWIVGLFNRESYAQVRTLNFASELGMPSGYVRDLWAHTDFGEKSLFAELVPAHGCKIYRISANPVHIEKTPSLVVDFSRVAPKQYILSGAKDAQLKVYTVEGTLVCSMNHISDYQPLDMRHLSDGFYVIRVENKGESRSFKIIL